MTVSRTDARSPDLVIVGASVRAFAESARRAGWRVHAADLFGDLDLAAVADSVVVARGGAAGYPQNLLAACERFPPAAFCYTGALENHPAVVAALAAKRPLLGASVAAVRAARDVSVLAKAVREAGLLFPETRLDAAHVPRDGSFLVKPLAVPAGGASTAGPRRPRGDRGRLDASGSGSSRAWPGPPPTPSRRAARSCSVSVGSCSAARGAAFAGSPGAARSASPVRNSPARCAGSSTSSAECSSSWD